MNKTQWTLGIIATLAVIAVIVLGIILLNQPTVTPGITQDQVNAAINQAIAGKDASISTLQSQVSSLTSQLQSQATAVSTNGTAVSTPETTVVLGGYLIDKLYLNTLVSDTYSDREVKTLFDGTYEFGDNEYDAKEVLTLTNATIKANEEDFKGNAYLLLPENSISYSVIFENALNKSKIDEDNTLSFNFLGQNYDVSSWEGNSITLTKGTEYQIKEGESVDVNGKTVTIVAVSDNSVYVKVGDETKKILEGNMYKVGGLEIYVKSAIYLSKASSQSIALVMIGDDVKQTISNGDEYAEDSVWEYVISGNSVGIVLNDDFTDLNEDNNKALAKDESLCLPNNYVCVKFNGLAVETSEEYKFNTDTRSGLDYAVVRGKFQNGLNDYDKVYINASGIYDQDLVMIGNSVELDNLVLNGTGSSMIIDNIVISLNITSVKVGTQDISFKEDDYSTDYGIIVKTPETYLDNNVVKIVVPKEQVEGSISLV